ncbi:MAG TPA: PAS domain-containing protein [Actinomycetes bacterium]|nr:PAS domain-containing protein [Actinomycetes bacterium]
MTTRPARGAARLAAILDSLPDALLLIDSRGIVINANTRALDLFETPDGPLVGRPIGDVLVRFDVGKVVGRSRRRKDRRGDRTEPDRLTGRRTDGTTFGCEVSTSFLSSTGEEDLLVVVIRASSTAAAFSTANEDTGEVARQARQTELILRAASEAIVGVDAQGKIILANPAAARMLRCKASELAGRDLHELAHHSRADGSSYPRDESPLVETLRTGRRAKSREEVLWRRDGSMITVAMNTFPVADGNSLAGAIITYTDRSDLIAARKRRDELVNVMRRELGRPLRRARNDLARIAAGEYGELPATAQGALDELGTALDRLVRIVSDSLDQDRAEAGKTPLTLERIEAAKLIQLAIEATSAAAEAAGVRITNDADGVGIDADPDRLGKALTTVLQTAVRSAPAGSAVTVVAKRRGEQLRIVIRGTGTGLPPRIMERPSYDDRDDIEAAIMLARRTVEQHGGRMVLNSSAADGTTCSIELPLPTPPQIDAATIIQVRPGATGEQAAISNSGVLRRPAGIPAQPEPPRIVQARPQQADLPAAATAPAAPAPVAPPPAEARPTPAAAPAAAPAGPTDPTPATPTPATTPATTPPATTPPATTPPATPPPAAAPAAAAAPPVPAPAAKSSERTARPGSGWSVGPDTMASPLPDVADLPSVADLPPIETSPRNAGRLPSTGGLLALPKSVLVWPQAHEATAISLNRLGWHSIPVGTPHDLTGYLSREPSALLIDPLTGPVTRTALTVIRNSAVEVGLPLIVAAGLGEVSANALYGSDPAALLRALIPSGRKDGRPARVLLIEGDATVATVLGSNLERRGMQVVHSTSESEAVLRAAITPPDLVVTDLMLTRPRGPGIVDWLRLHDRLAETPMVTYTTAALEPVGYERLRRGETVLMLQGRAETPAVEERLTLLVERMSGHSN